MIQRTSRALRFLRTTARNSPWLVIAAALHFLLLVSLAFVHFAGKDSVDATPRVGISHPKVPQPPRMPEPPVPDIPMDRNRIPQVPPELATDENYLPTMPIDTKQDLHDEAGNPNRDLADFEPPSGGGNIGVGSSDQRRGIAGQPSRGPGDKPSRFSGTNAPPGRNPGVTKKTEEAVLEGLRWLVRHQRSDGSWSPVGMGALCSHGKPCIPSDASVTANYDEGLTGLALLTFLGAGLSNKSDDVIVDTAMAKPYRTGTVVANALQWLIKRQHEDGSFSDSGFLYNEALATMAMCEAYGTINLRKPYGCC